VSLVEIYESPFCSTKLGIFRLPLKMNEFSPVFVATVL
jgi:hypothetical protein